MNRPDDVSKPSAPAPMTLPVLLERDAIAGQVARLADEITREHPGGVVLVGVLKGALIFLADLARAITEIPVVVDFISISRYAPDSGRVRILCDLSVDIEGRDVVIVEDLVDTGLTLAYLVSQLEARRPRRIEICTLLDRSVRRIVPLPVHYRGLEIGDVFVLGCGLHYQDLYRNVPYVVEGDRRVVQADPDAYVAELYGAGRRA